MVTSGIGVYLFTIPEHVVLPCAFLVDHSQAIQTSENLQEAAEIAETLVFSALSAASCEDCLGFGLTWLRLRRAGNVWATWIEVLG